MLSQFSGVRPELAVPVIARTAFAGLFALMLAIGAQASQNPAPANPAREQSQQWLVEALGNEIFGTAYSGYREGQHPDKGDGAVYPSREEILEDLDILIDYDLRLIRLYDAGPYSRHVLELIRERQLPFRVILGIWLKAEISNHEGCSWLLEPIPDEELAVNAIANEREVQAGIALAREFSDVIVAVNVGNEALVEWNDHMMSVERVIAFVRQVKAGIEQPVTVAENFDWWRKSGAALGREVDFLGVHSYPMIDGDGRPIEEALAFTIENIEAVRAAIPDKPIAILEAGWATTSGRFPEQASEVNQKRYLQELRDWAYASKTPVLFFEAFDEPWKGDENDHLETEKHWGLMFENRSPKLALQGHSARQYREDAVVWAVNFGGEAYEDPVGVVFEADPQGTGATLRGIVDGTQKTDVFDSYRSGPQDIVRQLPDGEYDLTFLFTEPDGLGVGERVFDVLVQGRTVLDLSLIHI